MLIGKRRNRMLDKSKKKPNKINKKTKHTLVNYVKKLVGSRTKLHAYVAWKQPIGKLPFAVVEDGQSNDSINIIIYEINKQKFKIRNYFNFLHMCSFMFDMCCCVLNLPYEVHTKLCSWLQFSLQSRPTGF